jgi:hypothetical protein
VWVSVRVSEVGEVVEVSEVEVRKVGLRGVRVRADTVGAIEVRANVRVPSQAGATQVSRSTWDV